MKRSLATGLAAAVTLGLPPLQAPAHPGGAPDTLVLLSGGPSPFAGCPVDPDPLDGREPALELEATVAVDPANPRGIVAAWVQGENVGIVAAGSSDGGRTWHRAVVPGITRCSGGTSDIAFNPSLSFGPDGTVYLAATASGGYFPTDPRAAATRVMVSRSSDGGRSWDTNAIPRSDGAVDYPWVAADPKRAGHLLAVWSRRSGAVDTTWASRSVDGGGRWSDPSLVRVSAPGRVHLNRVHGVGRDAFALITLDTALAAGTATRTVVARSDDGGRSWRDTAAFEGAGGIASAARGKALHLGLSTVAGDGDFTYAVASSSDGGRSFADRRRVRSFAAGTPEPELAVDAAGALAVLALVPESDDGARAIRYLHSHGAGRRWKARRLASTRLPTDVSSFYLRPFVAGRARGFAAVTVMAPATEEGGRTDVYHGRLRASARRRSGARR